MTVNIETSMPDLPDNANAGMKHDDAHRFNIPDLPRDEALPWGGKSLAQTFEEAKSLWQEGRRKLQAAAEHYVLDGHVSKHSDLLLFQSALYR